MITIPNESAASKSTDVLKEFKVNTLFISIEGARSKRAVYDGQMIKSHISCFEPCEAYFQADLQLVLARDCILPRYTLGR